LAKAYQESQISWNAQGWKNFVKAIRGQTLKEVRKALEEVKYNAFLTKQINDILDKLK